MTREFGLSEAQVRFATSGAFGALTTLRPDGSPSTQMMWVDADERGVLINTEIHRRKFRDLQRDPRVAVMIVALTDPYTYLEVRGVVDSIVGGHEAREHIDALAHRYKGAPYASPIASERVIVRIRPTHPVHEHGTIDRPSA